MRSNKSQNSRPVYVILRDRFLKQTKREYSPQQRLAALLVEAIFFVVVFPYLLIVLGELLNKWLKLAHILYSPANQIIGCLFILAGWVFAMWSIYVQYTLGKGTPVPIMATQKLIVQPPYTYCRNPMTLGSIVLYLGIAVVFGSIGVATLVLLCTAWLLTYIKLFEEKEMEARFGVEYLEYKRKTPFLIPSFRKRS